MKKLTKPYIVVYDENNSIISKLTENRETTIGEGRFGAEFDTEEELNNFIIMSGLKEVD